MYKLVLVITTAAARAECVVKKQTHAFYYLWYGTPTTDGKWLHWDHAVLPHWTKKVRAQYKHLENYTHEPPTRLHAPFYPAAGPYSSSDPQLLDAHFSQLRDAGVDAAVLSWTGRPGGAVSDTQGVGTDAIVPLAIAAAKRAGIGAAIHLEPYEGRGAESVALDLAHLVTHDLYRLPRRPCGGHDRLPVVYLYDAYHTPAKGWARLFCDDGDLSVRGTPHDVVVIATLLNRDEEELVVNGCFDGFYSYFATDGFTHGSTSAHWKLLAAWARKKNLWFSPSAGPGYNDTRIRPWNDIATRDRRNGAYYRQMLGAAVESGADLVSITSWNEWGEGTQIEPARAPADDVGDHMDYGANPNLYLDITREATERWRNRSPPDL